MPIDELLFPGVQVYCGEEPGANLLVLADVAVDDSFKKELGPNWASQASNILREVNRILSPVHIEINVASLQTWDSGNAVGHISKRLASAESNKETGKPAHSHDHRFVLPVRRISKSKRRVGNSPSLPKTSPERTDAHSRRNWTSSWSESPR